jgi:hypothetical protein
MRRWNCGAWRVCTVADPHVASRCDCLRAFTRSLSAATIAVVMPTTSTTPTAPSAWTAHVVPSVCCVAHAPRRAFLALNSI